jgi:hypothetical protein
MVALSLFRVREGGGPLFINQRQTLFIYTPIPIRYLMNINIREPPKTGDGFRSKDDQIGTGREPPIPESPQGFSAKGGDGFIRMASPATGKSPRVGPGVGYCKRLPKIMGVHHDFQ